MDISIFVQIIPLVVISTFAFWKSNVILFMIAGGLAMMAGLQWYDVYTTSPGLAVSLSLMLYSFLCFSLAFKYIFWRET